MPELLKEQGVYTHLISDHLHYWEDGGCDYHNRYNSWEIVRGQEGDHWKASLKDPAVPEVVKVPQKQQGGGVASGWRYDWVNRSYIREEADFPQTQCFDRGCEFLEKNHDADNWLLHLETFDPHEPFYVPQKYLDLYPEDYDGKHFDWPRGIADETQAEIRHVRRQYQALVTMCDHSLGRILDLMDKYSMWEDTMLIVGTDHGFLLAEHDYWGKNQMPYYNEIAHTPLFVWDPRYQIAGQHRKSIVQIMDWMPTLLQYFGVPIPKDVQGKPMDGILTSDTQPGLRPIRRLLRPCEHHRHPPRLYACPSAGTEGRGVQLHPDANPYERPVLPQGAVHCHAGKALLLYERLPRAEGKEQGQV